MTPSLSGAYLLAANVDTADNRITVDDVRAIISIIMAA
jgi:hypothetical protein